MAIASYKSRLRELNWDLCEWAKFTLDNGDVVKLKRKRVKDGAGETKVLKLHYSEDGDFVSLDDDDYCSCVLVPIEHVVYVEIANEGQQDEE